jgi:hypothetical protein
VALGQVFSENFGFLCQYTFHLLLHNHLHYHPRLAQKARSGRSANRLTNQKLKKKTLPERIYFLLVLSLPSLIQLTLFFFFDDTKLTFNSLKCQLKYS